MQRQQLSTASAGQCNPSATVPKHVRHNYEMLPLILAQCGQENHMPSRTQAEYFQLSQLRLQQERQQVEQQRKR